MLGGNRDIYVQASKLAIKLFLQGSIIGHMKTEW